MLLIANLSHSVSTLRKQISCIGAQERLPGYSDYRRCGTLVDSYPVPAEEVHV
jgi:hypothetical protein